MNAERLVLLRIANWRVYFDHWVLAVGIEGQEQDGVFNAEGTNTAVVEGAGIFLNRPGFAGGAGCALHLAAEADGESPIDWKPSVCWQLPIRVEWVAPTEPGGPEVATVRAWRRADWGDDGEPMAWCCTEGDRAYVGDRPVVESLAEELEEIVGTPVLLELRRRWNIMG